MRNDVSDRKFLATEMTWKRIAEYLLKRMKQIDNIKTADCGRYVAIADDIAMTSVVHAEIAIDKLREASKLST